MMRSWLVLVLVLATAWAGAEAEEAGFAFPEMAAAERVKQRSFRVKMLGKEAGDLTYQRGQLPDGRTLAEVRMALQMKRSNLGQEDAFRIEWVESELTDKDGRLVATRVRKVESGVEETAECVYSPTHVAVVQTGPGGTYKHSFELPANLASTLQVWTALTAAWERGKQPEREYTTFDAQELRFKSPTATLSGKTVYQHGGEEHTCWHVREVDDEDGVTEFRLGMDLIPLEVRYLGGVIVATWADAPAPDGESASASITSMISVDRTVDRMLDLESLELRLVLDPPPAADDPPLFESGRYQTVTPDPAGVRLALHAQRVPESAATLALPITTDDSAISKYLAATAAAQSDHPEIIEQARSLVENASDASHAVRQIVGWVWAQVEKESGSRGSATALEVLRSKCGDCTEHAVLVVALCRAAGIPARAAGGLTYIATEGEALAGFHAWTEVWLGQWTPVDATIPETGTSARYVLAGYDEPGEPGRTRVYAALLSRNAHLDVLAWRHAGAARVEAPRQEPAEADVK